MKGFYNKKTGVFLTELQIKRNRLKGRKTNEFVIELELTEVQAEVLITFDRQERSKQRLARMHNEASIEKWNKDTNWEAMDSTPTAEVAMIERETEKDEKARLDLAINCLDSQNKEIVRLHFYEGRNYTEIGAILGISRTSAMRCYCQTFFPTLC